VQIGNEIGNDVRMSMGIPFASKQKTNLERITWGIHTVNIPKADSIKTKNISKSNDINKKSSLFFHFFRWKCEKLICSYNYQSQQNKLKIETTPDVNLSRHAAVFEYAEKLNIRICNSFESPESRIRHTERRSWCFLASERDVSRFDLLCWNLLRMLDLWIS